MRELFLFFFVRKVVGARMMSLLGHSVSFAEKCYILLKSFEPHQGRSHWGGRGGTCPPNNFGNCYKKPIKTAKITKIPTLCPPNIQVPPQKFFRCYAPAYNCHDECNSLSDLEINGISRVKKRSCT